MQSMGFLAAGMSEMIVLVLALGGVGLPLGMPPEKEDPNLAFVAPENCVLYATWAGMAQADPASKNQTEQLLAEPELKRFAAALDDSFGKLMARLGSEDDPRAKVAGKTAPLWARTLLTRPAAIFVSRLAPRGESLDIEAGIVLGAGDKSAELAQSMVELLGAIPGEGATELTEVTIGGRKFHRLSPQPGGLPAPLTFGSDGKYFYVGLGEQAIDQMLSRMAAKKVPTWLTKVQQDLTVERRASLSFVNVKVLRETLLPLAGEEVQPIVAALGLDQIELLQSVTGLDGEGIVSKSLVTIDGQSRGILKLLEGPGIKADNLAHIPADTLIALAVSFDSSKAFDTADGLIREIGGPRVAQEWEESLRGLEDAAGLRVKEDLLASLGSTWTFSLSPADGWLAGMVATAEVKDKARLLAAHEKILELIKQQGEQLGTPVEIKKTAVNGHDVYHLSLIGVPFPVQPAWCISDKQVIVSLFPQTVRSILGRPQEEKPIGERPEVAAALAGEGNVVAITYADSQRWFESTYGYVQMFLPMMQQGIGQGFRELDGGEPPQFLDAAMLPSSRSIHRHLRPSVTVVRRTSRGLESSTRQTLPTANVGATAPVAVALLLPAVQSAREAARRMQSSNNLKQIGIAMHTYHDTWRRFPASHTLTAEGKPKLSWRVHMLPYVEQNELYEQFHLDEPWDSEHNKKLIEKMPEVYRCPSSKAEPGKTVYLGVKGKNAAFVEPDATDKGKDQAAGISLSAVLDGTSNTMMVVEAADESAVIWTKPDDFAADEKDPFKGLINKSARGFNACFCDGAVHFLTRELDPEMLKRLIQRNDGQVVELPE